MKISSTFFNFLDCGMNVFVADYEVAMIVYVEIFLYDLVV